MFLCVHILNPMQVLYDLTKFASSRLSVIPNDFVYDVSNGECF